MGASQPLRRQESARVYLEMLLYSPDASCAFLVPLADGGEIGKIEEARKRGSEEAYVDCKRVSVRERG
jgi:hypothetical protein